MLDVDCISKTFHGIAAVRSLSLRAEPGRVVGLLGPNGSGKSTTIRMLAGLIRPSRGVIYWNGHDIQTSLDGYQRVLGYVPEEPHLYAYLTAREYLELVGGLHGLERRVLDHRIAQYLALFELEGDVYTPLSSFSKGMRQKVLIAAALLHDPELIILDEPCSGLDVGSILIHRRMISALATRGKTIIYSSHELDLVEKICDEVLILHNSDVVAHDSVSRLRALAQAASLEQAFATLAVDRDVDRIGDRLAVVATS